MKKGGFCTELLADYGADVIRIGPPAGDPDRRKAPFPGDEPQGNSSLYFAFFNTNKKSVTLNLESEGGHQLFRRLVQGAEPWWRACPLTTWRPGTGLPGAGPDQLSSGDGVHQPLWPDRTMAQVQALGPDRHGCQRLHAGHR